MEHNGAIRDGLGARPVAACTDIASYFEGIDIDLLVDLVRSTVDGKATVISLLEYFLRHSRVQYDYGLNTNTGLPQEDIDCSRTLAYFYLHPHDDRIVQFAVEKDCELFRFADDITILSQSEAGGRRALKAVTDSLRELGLMASIEKTEILQSTDALDQLMYRENSELDALDQRIVEAAKKGDVPPELTQELIDLYQRWETGPESKKKNWRKLLKRIYTAATLCRAPFLLDWLESHIVDYPSEIHDKITKYLVRIQREVDLEAVVERVLAYLSSDENLYPSLETTLLEAFLHLEYDLIPAEARAAIGAHGRRLALEDQEPLSDYARAMGMLLCFRFENASVDAIAERYLETPTGSGILRKYMVFVGLTAADSELRAKVLARARTEQDLSLNRLTGLVENLSTARGAAVVQAYLRRRSLYFVGLEVIETYNPIRQEILEKLIELYGSPA